MIVKLQVVRQALSRGARAGILAQAHLFIFHRPPEPFREDVIERSPFAVHADPDQRCFQARDILWTRDERPLDRLKGKADLTWFNFSGHDPLARISE